jgi:DnaJ-class molecular chaperone
MSREKCTRCEGKGWHAVRNPDPLLPGTFEVDCKECRGTGVKESDQ